MKRLSSRIAAATCALVACGLAAVGAWPLRSGYMRTEDRNHDGRPDVWKFYDTAGHLRRTLTDTNFDGASDVDEYFEFGALSRRVIDRNFDRRADRDDKFDAVTHERVRSVVDTDFDGRADLLVLFQDGRPVHTTWASALPSDVRRVEAPQSDAPSGTPSFAPMADPFRGTTSFRSVHLAATLDPAIALLDTGALPAAPVRAGPPVAAPTSPHTLSESFASASAAPCAPRGPPSPFLI